MVIRLEIPLALESPNPPAAPACAVPEEALARPWAAFEQVLSTARPLVRLLLQTPHAGAPTPCFVILLPY